MRKVTQLLSTQIHFYGFTSYIFQGEYGDYQEVKVCVDMVEISMVDNESGFASVKAILKHHGNDEQRLRIYICCLV